LPGSDNVVQVHAEWRAMFSATAVLLVLTEAGATVVGVMMAVRRQARRLS
jgi:hypothetical protein